MRDLSKEQISALLTAARRRRERDWLMILVSYHHGLRVSELLQLTGSSITKDFIKIDSLKASEPAVQALIHSADPLFSEVPALFDYSKNCRPNQRLFKLTRQRAWQLMKEYAEIADVPLHKAFPHALRHSCGRQLIDKIGIHRTQKYMRHKSMSSTWEYLKVTEEEASDAAKKVFSSD